MMEGLAIGRFRITRKIGSGGMAEVYEARHELMDRYAAVKLLRPEMSARELIVRRFFQEAQAAASIEHPGIVHVYDVGYMPDGRAYLVMELLAGETLSQRVQRHQRLSLEATVIMIRQLAGVMGVAHQRGIVHRDLKPDNIFLVPDPEMPQGERVKVLDFGLAKLLEVAFPREDLTAQGSVFGTPAYMAPEQCRNSGDVDQRADLYAMGCIFYMCLCGKAPFGTGGIEVLLAHVGEQPVPPSQHAPNIPPGIEELILQLLAKNPEQRLPTCETFIAQLDRVVEILPGGLDPGRSQPSDELTMRDNATLQGALAFAVRQVAGTQPGGVGAPARPGTHGDPDPAPARPARRAPPVRPSEPTQHLNTQALMPLDLDEDTDRISVPATGRKVTAGQSSATGIIALEDLEQLSEIALEPIEDEPSQISDRETARVAVRALVHQLPTERLTAQSAGLAGETRPLRKQERAATAETMRISTRALPGVPDVVNGRPRTLPGVPDATTGPPRALPGVPDAMTGPPHALPGVRMRPPSAQPGAASAARTPAPAMQLMALPWEPDGTGGGVQQRAETAGQGENASRGSSPTLSSGELEHWRGREPRRPINRRAVWGLAGLGCFGALMVALLALATGSDTPTAEEEPTTVEDDRIRIVEQPPENAENKAQIDALQKQIEQATKEQDWDKVIELSDKARALGATGDGQGDPLDGLAARARAEKVSQGALGDLGIAAEEQRTEDVLEALGKIPAASVYRAEANTIAQTAVLIRADKLTRRADCKELDELIEAAAPASPEAQDKLKDHRAKCAQAAERAARATSPRDPRKIFDELRAAYDRGNFQAAASSCHHLRNSGHMDDKATILCGLVACKNKNKRAAKYYYQHSSLKSRGSIAQFCLKESGFDVQK